MRPTLYTVQRDRPGRLSTMAKPRGDDWLDDEMRDLRRNGVDVLVCALTDPELRDLGLGAEAAAAHHAGLAFVAIPAATARFPTNPQRCPTSTTWSHTSAPAATSSPTAVMA